MSPLLYYFCMFVSGGILGAALQENSILLALLSQLITVVSTALYSKGIYENRG